MSHTPGDEWPEIQLNIGTATGEMKQIQCEALLVAKLHTQNRLGVAWSLKIAPCGNTSSFLMLGSRLPFC